MLKSDLPLVTVVIPTCNRRDLLIRLLGSIEASDYPSESIEVIVVDDLSTDGTPEAVAKVAPKAKVLVTQIKTCVSATRNMGISAARGDLIFLVDDDNVIDPHCLTALVEAFISHPDAGLVGPMMFYYSTPNVIWCAGVDRSMVTSITRFVGRDEEDRGQLTEISPSKDFPNAFMLSRRAIEKAGGFNDRLFPQHYEESDIAERVRRAGFEVLVAPAAKVWHDIPPPCLGIDRLRLLHVHDPKRAYLAGRNRVIFFRLYSSPVERTLYLGLFNWVMAAYYLLSIYRGENRDMRQRTAIARNFIAGMLDGLMIRLGDASRQPKTR